MKIKTIAITAAGVGIIAAPIIATVSSNVSAYTTSKYAITFTTTAPIKTLNLFKAQSQGVIDQYSGLMTSGLLRTMPDGAANGGLETNLSLQKYFFGYYSPPGDITKDAYTNEQTQKAFQTGDHVNRSASYRNITGDLATEGVFYKGPGGNGTAGIGFKLREAKYWNGDRVTAEDFRETFYQILNMKNAVPYAYELDTVFQLHNAHNIINAQASVASGGEGLSFEQALKKYPLGFKVDDSTVIPEEELATSADGKAYFHAEYAKAKELDDQAAAETDPAKKAELTREATSHKRHTRFMFTFDQDAGSILSQLFTSSLGTPTSMRFIKKVGVDAYATSIDNMMGCGPYKPVYMDLDYKIVANKWNGYWDAVRTLSPQIQYRVIPDQTTSIQLFKQGKIGQVSFGTAMLPMFNGSTELRKSIKASNYAASNVYIGFNLNVSNPNAKYLSDDNLRKAIQYSVNRTQYLHAVGADNSYVPQMYAPETAMEDATGTTSLGYLYKEEDNLGNSAPHANQFKVLDGFGDKDASGNPTGYIKMATHSPSALGSTDPLKNGKEDYLYRPELAKAYFAAFKKDHPEFTTLDLSYLTDASTQDNVLSIAQDINENLPGITITLKPKPSTILTTERAKFDYDLTDVTWGYDYPDAWTYYHNIADKEWDDGSVSDTADTISKGRINENGLGASYGLIDYIADKYTEDPHYFDQFNISPEILGQIIREEITIGSKNPSSTGLEYVGNEDKLWEPTRQGDKDNKAGTAAFKESFSKFTAIGKANAGQWYANLRKIADAKDSTGKQIDDNWKDHSYRNGVVYPAMEKIIRDSGLAILESHLQNKYIASRLVGTILYTNRTQYFGFEYQTNNIPDTNYPLPSEEMIARGS